MISPNDWTYHLFNQQFLIDNTLFSCLIYAKLHFFLTQWSETHFSCSPQNFFFIIITKSKSTFVTFEQLFLMHFQT